MYLDDILNIDKGRLSWYCIDKEGLHTMHTKVSAIVEVPTPKNVHQVRPSLAWSIIMED